MPGNLSEPCGGDCLEWVPKDTTRDNYPHLAEGLENNFSALDTFIIYNNTCCLREFIRKFP